MKAALFCLLLFYWGAFAANQQMPVATAGDIVLLQMPKVSSKLPSARYGLSAVVTLDLVDRWGLLIGVDNNTLPGRYLVYWKSAAPDAISQAPGFVVQPRAPTFTTDELAEPFPFKLPFSGKRSSSMPELPFIWPLEGDWQNQFGSFSHSDLAKEKKQINYVWFQTDRQYMAIAPQRARVSKIAQQNNASFSIALDHGMGLFSFIHGLQNLTVTAGDQIVKGAMLGNVAANKRVYWQCQLNGALINPETLIRLNLK